ncbi:TonB-dependent receptor [Caulobacter segnis]|uniref:TonB-dependent receptor n=1 Tax=Caulobacter segnis TaxID=88688 RepID=UPI001CC179D4|nr:TonB-dependent receptor [Caulobacter segnis]UAL10198.1 TonB-dependent receptor [Caulobacter segnis]
MIVTAAKRPSRAFETPTALTVLTGARLVAAHADDAAGFAALTPGLTYTDSGPGQKRYALRGLQSAGEPEVALYYDDIPISGLPGSSLDTGDSQPDLKLWDVDRIEVIRGPQGTLYGNGAMGGAIRILSRPPNLSKPEAALEGGLGATDGGEPSYRVNALLNLPLVDDRLAARVSGYGRREGGWIDDPERSATALPQVSGDNRNDERTYGGRAALRYAPNDRFEATLTGYGQSLKTDNAFEIYPKYATDTDRYVSAAYVRTPWKDRSLMGVLSASYDLGWAKASAATSYQYRHVRQTLDTTRYLLKQLGCAEYSWPSACAGGGTIVPAASAADQRVSAWSAEARLASPDTASAWTWIAGVFQQRAITHRRGQVAKVGADGLIAYDADGTAQNRLFARDNKDGFDQVAVFGEVTRKLTPRLSASLGGRWFDVERRDQQVVVQQFFPGQPTGAQPAQTSSESRLFKTARLSYALDRGLLFLQAAQGFRAGGPNYPGGFDLSAPAYRSDSVWDYELGWKLALGSRVRVEGAVFDIEWKDLQQLVPTTLFSYIANAGRARSQGAEAAVDLKLASGWSANLAATYNHARLVGRQPTQTDPALQLAAGDRLANVPDWTWRAGLNHERALSRGEQLSLALGAHGQSGRGVLTSDRNPAYFRLKAYGLADAHASLEFPSGWRVSLDVDNLFNAYAPMAGKSLDANLAQVVTAARPRTAWLTVSIRR